MDASKATALQYGSDNLNPSTLADNVAEMASGDEAGLNALYDATVTRVYGLALRITGKAEAAEEVVVEVYFQAWREAARYDAKRGKPSTWLLTICRSRALDALRRGDKAESHSDPESMREEAVSGGDPIDLLMVSQRDTEIHKALQSLDSLPRQMIALAFFKGYTHEEIAQHVAMPLGTVKTHLRKALKHLAQMMAKTQQT